MFSSLAASSSRRLLQTRPFPIAHYWRSFASSTDQVADNVSTGKSAAEATSNSNENDDYTKNPFPVDSLPSNEEATKILKDACKLRSLQLNNKLQKKPWRMALMIHRHDKGAQTRDEIDGDFRHGIQPQRHDIVPFIRLQTKKKVSETEIAAAALHPDSKTNRKKFTKAALKNMFSEQKQKAAKIEMLRLRVLSYVEEAIHVLKDRNAWDNQRWKMPIEPTEKPDYFLNYFYRVIAQQEAEIHQERANNPKSQKQIKGKQSNEEKTKSNTNISI